MQHAGLAGGARVAVGGVGRHLFVTGGDERMLLPRSASRKAITVWPQRPKITSTPSRSRYSTSW